MTRRGWTGRRRLFAGLAGAGLAALLGTALMVRPPSPLTIASAHPVRVSSPHLRDVAVEMPHGAPTGLALVVSDRGGPGATKRTVIAALRARGLIVLPIDLERWREGLVRESGPCLHPIVDVEVLSKETQRSLGAQRYLRPVVVGSGEGGAMAAAIVARSLAATIAGGVALDPSDAVGTDRPLCDTPGDGPPEARDAGPAPNGFAYGRTERMQAPLTVLAARDDPPGAVHPGAGHFIPERYAEPDPRQRIGAAVDAAVALAAQDAGTGGLPLVDLPALGPPRAVALFFSGDGGWRDIDKTIGERLAQDGVHVVGVDALRYFWTDRSPTTVAADTAAILKQADPTGGLPVLVLGYSYGADVFPFAWPHLPASLRNRVSLIALLGPGRSTGFSISVKGWLGMGGEHAVLPQIAGLPAHKVLCIYGSAEKEPACTDPALSGVAKVRLEGGHHFDGDYAGIARRILDAARLSG